MIRKATTKDIKSILRITKSCAKHMIKNGIFQWNEHYPNKSEFEKDIDRNELYVLEIDKIIIGCIVISTFMDEDYIPVNWLTLNTNNIYIHRLAIHPEYQGQKLAKKLMDYAENFAKTNNFSSVRLDTFSKNKRNQIFYELRGYKKLDEIFFSNQSDFPFYCYELVL